MFLYKATSPTTGFAAEYSVCSRFSRLHVNGDRFDNDVVFLYIFSTSFSCKRTLSQEQYIQVIFLLAVMERNRYTPIAVQFEEIEIRDGLRFLSDEYVL